MEVYLSLLLQYLLLSVYIYKRTSSDKPIHILIYSKAYISPLFPMEVYINKALCRYLYSVNVKYSSLKKIGKKFRNLLMTDYVPLLKSLL